MNFYIEGGGLAMDQNSLTVSGRDVKTSLEALDGYFARPWNQAVGFHAVKTTGQASIVIGDVVTFDKELLDVGNGYDPSTSGVVFGAPQRCPREVSQELTGRGRAEACVGPLGLKGEARVAGAVA